MNQWLFVTTRLWRYFSLYFLKPFDAVNDTLTASLVYRLNWSGDFVEIGSGDGVYSYIMHGGSFPIWFDRYLLTDLGRADIYDTHRENILPRANSLDFPIIKKAIDAKRSHVEKIKEIGFAQEAICAPYEQLPLLSESVEAVFFYTPHGLKDHLRALDEARRILRPGGRMLILLYDSRFKSAFLCHWLAQSLPGAFGRYFERLDSGRYKEITNLSKLPEEWEALFRQCGFSVVKCNVGLSTFAWKVYDIQTRPLLKSLIRLFNMLPSFLRTLFKIVWMVIWFPIILVFYVLFSREFVRIGKTNCYLAYELKKSTSNS
ncbi:MAG: methyltransferase domain-containing protein [Gammaproteobacteria bacterium]|nr:methyltransferase domain-containing protein [Gammaproteobacteria bacterium]